MALSSPDPDENVVRITLRIPKYLHSRLVEATEGGNSMNAEIVRRLMDSFPLMEEERRQQIGLLKARRASARQRLEQERARIAEIDERIRALETD